MTDPDHQAGDAAAQGTEPAGPTAAAFYVIALGHLRAGRLPEAELSCREALALEGNHADALHLMGLLSLQAEQPDQAVDWIARAIRSEPKPIYLSSLGTCLLSLGRREDALHAFDKAVQLRPDDANLWRDLGKALAALGRADEAVLSFQHALRLDPQHWDAANQCGSLLHGRGRIEEALSYFELCDALRPDHVPTLQMRAACLQQLKRPSQALALCRQAHALAPDDATICNNLGAILRSQGNDADALPWFERALALRAGFRDALHNKAAALAKLRRFDEAFAVYQRLTADDPGDAAAALAIAHLHLLTGNFAAGWAGREARWKLVGPRNFTQPMWLGREPLEGKTILIATDEGLGDTLQLVRYVPMVAARGARVVFAVQDALYPLLSKLPQLAASLPISATAQLPPFDLHCSIMSLPLAFDTRLDTIPAAVPYLPAPDDDRLRRWKQRLGPHDRLRVGLCWAGNPRQPDDHNRSTGLRSFSRLLDLDATFISLQKETKPEDRTALQEYAGIVDLTADLTDFAETAALVSCLDLVISVETSVAHLAGAMGLPTWTLLCYTPDHRWLLDRDDSPWYPTMRLFRQTSPGDWAGVIERVRGELETEITAFAAKLKSVPQDLAQE